MIGVGERLTPFALSHRYIVEGCESDRTGCQLPLTSCSTSRNDSSSLRLFFGKANISQRVYITRRDVAYARISPNKLGPDSLAGGVRRRRVYINQYVPEIMADAGAVENDSSLDDGDGRQWD